MDAMQKTGKGYTTIMAWARNAKNLEDTCTSLLGDGKLWTGKGRLRVMAGSGAKITLPSLTEKFSVTLTDAVVVQRKLIPWTSCKSTWLTMAKEVYPEGGNHVEAAHYLRRFCSGKQYKRVRRGKQEVVQMSYRGEPGSQLMSRIIKGAAMTRKRKASILQRAEALDICN